MKKLLTAICFAMSAMLFTACVDQEDGDADITIPVLENSFEATLSGELPSDTATTMRTVIPEDLVIAYTSSGNAVSDTTYTGKYSPDLPANQPPAEKNVLTTSASDVPLWEGDIILLAEVTEINESCITVNTIAVPFGEAGTQIVLYGSYDFESGDIVEISIAEDAEIVSDLLCDEDGSHIGHIEIREEDVLYIFAANVPQDPPDMNDYVTFMSRIAAHTDDGIIVEIQSDAGIFGKEGKFLTIREIYMHEDYNIGDYWEITLNTSAPVDDGIPEGVSARYAAELSLWEQAAVPPLNATEFLARVDTVSETKNGSFAMTVTSFEFRYYGSGFGELVSFSYDEKFETGDWIKVSLADEVGIDETYPLQIEKGGVLSIEKV